LLHILRLRSAVLYSTQDTRNNVRRFFMNNLKTKWLISLIAIALMLTVVTVANAQSNITATLSIDRNDITVGDVVPLTLRVTHPAGWRVIVPALEKQWGRV